VGDALTEAHDLAVSRLGAYLLGVLVGAGEGFPDVGHPRRWRDIRLGHQVQSDRLELVANVFGDGHARGEPSRVNPSDENVVLPRVWRDEVVAVVDRSAKAGIRCGDFLFEQTGHQLATFIEEEVEAVLRGGRCGASTNQFWR